MSETPQTEPTESDPNADSAEGLAGGMGVSSERPGSIRGKDTAVTYDSAPTHTDAEHALDADGEAVVDQRYPTPQEDPNPFDTDRNARHGA